MDNQDNEFKILIASDCHLGHVANHPIRGDDSFRSFEEMLKAAVRMDVDFILLAGDLFDLNKPSVQTMERTMSLIRKYCFGGDGQQRFTMRNYKNANCVDPNLKIKYPIFTIHGNHDDPIGINASCCLDLFAASGLINYFGKQNNIEEISMKPIIFEKGSTKIIIYGFGSMREERLHSLIENERFNYLIPDTEHDSQEELRKYFKILLVHQNRVPRPGTKHLNPYDLTSLPDFVVWGHEHRACKEPEYFEPNKFFILQPGSTVATSLCEAEHGDKYYYLMRCHFDHDRQKPKFKIEPFRLETIRPFIIDTIDVDNILSKNNSLKSLNEEQQFLFSYCKNQIQTMLTESSLIGNDKPLIRLRIEYSDKQCLFDRRKLEFHVNKQVANGNDVVRFIRKRSNHKSDASNLNDDDDDDNDDVYGFIDAMRATSTTTKYNVQSMLIKHFDDGERLSIMDEKFFTEKLDSFVKKNDPSWLFDTVNNTEQAIQYSVNNSLDDRKHFKMQDFKNEIREIKQKISEDAEYRKRFQWIINEPFVERSKKILEKKISAKSAVAANINDERQQSTKKDLDPFFQDDIDMFNDDHIADDAPEDDDDDVDQKESKITRKKSNKSNSFFDMRHLDDDHEDDPMYGASPKKKPKVTKKSLITIEDSDSDDSMIEAKKISTFKAIPKPQPKGRGRGRRGRGK